MANLNGDNYKAQFVDKPSSKFPKGENAGRKRLLLEHYTTVGVIAANDVILGPKIPASSIVVDAKVKITSALGATSTFTLGYLANGVDSADDDAFVDGINANAGATLDRADASSAGIYKRFSEETQVALKCTGVTANSGVLIEFEVEYVND